jgi:hypothetical protein
MEQRENPKWSELLAKAVTEPGLISEAYTRFHGYSIGNRVAAIFQCAIRGIQPGPIATFQRWKELGRHVTKGSKAITLCMPVTVKAKDRESDGTEDSPEARRTLFVWRNNWFVLSQTEGAEYVPPALPEWDRARALAALQIEVIPFTHVDGNTQGYARQRSIAVNPVAANPEKTLFHEIGHVLLHTAATGEMSDSERLPRDLREVEAECVALICLESLGLPGAEYCRGYVQNWYGQQPIPETSAQRIFGAAEKILAAGEPESRRRSA